jgi:Kef-type K+ transport system membrane component KefB
MVVAVPLGVLVLAVTLGGEHLGLPAMISAVAIGLAIPVNDPAPVVQRLHRAGRALVPTFFVVTGFAVLSTDLSATPWVLFAIATVLAVAGKLAGGYLGARLGGQSRPTALRIGVLMNTRGLTELVVLQVGYSTGILTTPLFLALIVMAVVTTVATGPLLLLIDRREIASGSSYQHNLGSDAR